MLMQPNRKKYIFILIILLFIVIVFAFLVSYRTKIQKTEQQEITIYVNNYLKTGDLVDLGDRKYRFTNLDIGDEFFLFFNNEKQTWDYQLISPIEMSNYTDGKIENRKIIQPEILSNQLSYVELENNSQKTFLKKFIHYQNLKFLQRERETRKDEQQFIEQLFPIINKAQVLITGIVYPGDGMMSDKDSFQIATYQIGSRNKNIRSAQNTLFHVFDYLTQFNSEESKAKQWYLKRLQNNSLVFYYGKMDNPFYRSVTYDAKGNKVFQNKNAETIIFVENDKEPIKYTKLYFDPENKTEGGVSFDLAFSNGLESGDELRIEGKIENGKIISPEKISETLQKINDKNLDFFKYIVKDMNQKNIEDSFNRNQESQLLRQIKELFVSLLDQSVMFISSIEFSGQNLGLPTAEITSFTIHAYSVKDKIL